jgi:hypothetical protein
MFPIIARPSRIARTLHRDISARAHGDADFGGGKSRGLVEAVTGHADNAARRPQ